MNAAVRLRDVGATYGGLTGKTRDDFGRGNASFITFLEIINSTRLRGAALERVRVAKGERQNRVLRGDLLFNGSSETPEEVALSAVVDFDPDGHTYLNSFCFGFRLRPGISVDPIFLAYFFRSGAGRVLVSSLAQGATRYNIAKTKFLDVELDLPTVQRQREIVASLCDADDLIATLERMIAKKQAIKQGMMQQLLTGKTRLSSWPRSRLSELIDGLEAGVSVRSSEHASRGVAVLKTSAVDKGRFDPTKAKPVLPADVGRVRCNPVAGSLVISRMNTPALVGEVGYVEHDYTNLYLPDRLWLARPKRGERRKVNVRWLGYYLSSESGSRAVRELATGTSGSMKNIPKERLLALEVPTPPPLEQDRIAEAVRDADRAIDLFRDRLSKARDVKQGMMQELLPGHTRLPFKEGAA